MVRPDKEGARLKALLSGFDGRDNSSLVSPNGAADCARLGRIFDRNARIIAEMHPIVECFAYLLAAFSGAKDGMPKASAVEKFVDGDWHGDGSEWGW